MLKLNETIAAIATPNGAGGIAIVRMSGERAFEILDQMFRPANKKAKLTHAKMVYGFIEDGLNEAIDEVMVVRFFSPRSYTKEDVCEIHTHGGISAERVLESCVELGARPAEKGEFTYRAFMNGRISLDRAEAVMSLISAGSERAARSSIRQLREGTSEQIGKAKEKLKALVTLIDAAADFPEEIDEKVTAGTVRKETDEIVKILQKAADPRYARIVSEGARVVIAGRPNVGKSSIMNRLLGAERAIVTDIAGTTRDIINESVTINGLKITLSDTAGIRKEKETSDQIERIGIDRAIKSIEEADIVVLVLDLSENPDAEEEELLKRRDERFIIVANKDDIRIRNIPGAVNVSARTGEGIEELKRKIYEKASPGEEDDKLLSLRQLSLAEKAIEALKRITSHKESTFLDLYRQDLTEALEKLGEITGENVSESVIDGIFERFCVGK